MLELIGFFRHLSDQFLDPGGRARTAGTALAAAIVLLSDHSLVPANNVSGVTIVAASDIHPAIFNKI